MVEIVSQVEVSAEMVHEMKGTIPMIHDMARAYEWLHPHFQDRVRRHESLKRHSSFSVGGPADLWINVETQN